jgi:hypothetical protein
VRRVRAELPAEVARDPPATFAADNTRVPCEARSLRRVANGLLPPTSTTRSYWCPCSVVSSVR